MKREHVFMQRVVERELRTKREKREWDMISREKAHIPCTCCLCGLVLYICNSLLLHTINE